MFRKRNDDKMVDGTDKGWTLCSVGIMIQLNAAVAAEQEVEMLKKITTEKAPAAIGPYSQAIAAGNFLFASGQIPINPESGEVEAEGIEAQAEQVMKNVGAILEAAGTDYANVVKTTCFLADMADFAAFNGVYEKYFTEKPARSCVAVKALPKNVLCEVEVIAALEN